MKSIEWYEYVSQWKEWIENNNLTREYVCWENNQKYFRGESNQLHPQEVGPGRLLHAQGLPYIELTGLRLVHMSQFLQGGNFGCCMSVFFFKVEPLCDQTWWDSPIFSVVYHMFLVPRTLWLNLWGRFIKYPNFDWFYPHSVKTAKIPPLQKLTSILSMK